MAKNYFNNEEVESHIVTYLSYMEKNKDSKDAEVLLLKEKIFKEVSKIINGIIFTHKFTVWEAYDDLFQEASEACIKALPRFNPNFITSNGSKATAFNYFSLTTKRCLKFYTIRNKKNRGHLQIDDQPTLASESQHDISREIISESFIKQLKVFFSSIKYKKYVPLVDILEEYLIKIGLFNKREFFRFCKAYGWSPNLIRKFLKVIKTNKEKFYNEINN